jgi:RNA 2',3'-cyclic 3'-phosphodiesterase
MTVVRTFVAIDLAPAIRSALAALQARLAQGPGGSAGRWVKPEGIHLTLKFLGDVDTRRLPDLYAAIDRACARQMPFEVQVGGSGCFPNARRPRVVWVAVSGESKVLAELQCQIERECTALGYAAEERAFTPHLTLARIRQEAPLHEAQALGNATMVTQVDTLGRQHIERVHVFKSELRPEGALYSALHVSSLLDSRPLSETPTPA